MWWRRFLEGTQFMAVYREIYHMIREEVLKSAHGVRP